MIKIVTVINYNEILVPQHHYGSSLLNLANESLSVVIFVRRTLTVLWQYGWESLPTFIIICLKQKSQVRCWVLREKLLLPWLNKRKSTFQKSQYIPQPVHYFSSKAYITDLLSVPLIMYQSMKASSHPSACTWELPCSRALWRCCTVRKGVNVGTGNRRLRVGIPSRFSGQCAYFPVGVIRVCCYVNLKAVGGRPEIFTVRLETDRPWRFSARNTHWFVELLPWLGSCPF